jgi:coenzyme Q-binding protein COQ10
MFDLVADIQSYPEFIPYCRALRILTSTVVEGEGEMTAEMIVAYRAFRETFRSRVMLNRQDFRIEAHYLEGPFRKLHNFWRFSDVDEGAEIDFTIDFEFKSLILQGLSGAVFERVFARMSDAFVARAHEVYGG